MKEQYIESITKMMQETNDTALLHLIFTLLVKVGGSHE